MNREEALNVISRLNNMLKSMAVVGFIFGEYENRHFSPEVNYICFKALTYDNQMKTFVRFISIEHMFKKDVFQIEYGMYDLYSKILDIRTSPPLFRIIWNFKAINENGINFLRLAAESDSFEELELRLAIMGY